MDNMNTDDNTLLLLKFNIVREELDESACAIDAAPVSPI